MDLLDSAISPHQFKTPILPYFTDYRMDYLPTQYFTEYAKSKVYDGIMFLSSVRDKRSETEFNYVIFDYSKLEYIDTNVYFVSAINYESNKRRYNVGDLASLQPLLNLCSLCSHHQWVHVLQQG